MVDAVREAPRILLQVRGREKSAEKRVARGGEERFDSLLTLASFFRRESERGLGVVALLSLSLSLAF